jgi:t-SNARE complex subunit (syntaxin)
MLDRLRDLNKLAETNPHLGGDENSQDEEMAADGAEFMSDFFSGVNDVRISMKKIQNNIELLEEKYTEQLQKINPKDKKRLGNEADQIVDDTNKIANEVKEKLELMVKTDTTASVKQMQAQAAEERIKKNTHASLVQQFVEIMQHYQSAQAKYKQQYQDNVRRQILVVRPDATEEEINDTMESGNADRIFADKTVDKQKAAETALSYIRDRHQEIMKIEQSLNQLQQLFIDMAVLVAEQSEMITSIETNIENATGYMKEATTQLKKANKLAKRGRKCMIAIIVLCVALLGAVLTIILYFTVGPGANKSDNSTTPTATGSAAVFGDFSILNNAVEWSAYNKH